MLECPDDVDSASRIIWEEGLQYAQPHELHHRVSGRDMVTEHSTPDFLFGPHSFSRTFTVSYYLLVASFLLTLKCI